MLRAVYNVGYALKLTKDEVLALSLDEFVHWVVYLKRYAPDVVNTKK